MARPHILILRDATLGRTLSRTARTVLPGVYLISALLLVTGCANHSLVPAAQGDGRGDGDGARATHSAAPRAAIRRGGRGGARAFLDTKDGHLVVLPGDSPADAWARSVTSPEGGTDPASMPPVV